MRQMPMNRCTGFVKLMSREAGANGGDATEVPFGGWVITTVGNSVVCRGFGAVGCDLGLFFFDMS